MASCLTHAAAMAVLGGGVTAATAVAFARREPAFPQRVYTCRADGLDVPLGTRRCLSTPKGARRAECGIALNTSTWRPSDEACP